MGNKVLKDFENQWQKNKNRIKIENQTQAQLRLPEMKHTYLAVTVITSEG